MVSALLVFLLLATSPISALAEETLNETANRVCKAFIDHREDFKEIPLQPCEAYGVFGHKNENPDRTKCFSHELDGVQKKFAFFQGNGTCHGNAVANVAKDNQISVLPVRNPDINGYGFGNSDKPLDYQGFLLVTNEYDSDLRLVTKDDQVVLCGFVYEVQGWKSSDSNKDAVCEKFLQNKYEAQDGKTSCCENDNLYDGELERETHVASAADVDIEGTGKKVKILTIGHNSGAACGCGEEWLSIARTDSSSNVQMSRALSTLTASDGCKRNGNNWSPIEIDGRGYIIQNLRGPKTWKPLSTLPPNDRVLHKYKEGDFSEVCRLHPKVQKVIDGDVPNQKLDYVPVK